MRMSILRASRLVSRLLRSRETRVTALATAVVALVTMLVASATDGERVDQSALVTVAPTTSGKAHPRSTPASAVPLLADQPSPSTTALAPPAVPPPSITAAPSTTAGTAEPSGARRAASTAPALEVDAAPTTAPPGTAPPTTGAPAAPAPVKQCAVRLHGKGGGGSATVTAGDVTYISPTGNASGWGGRQWLYFPDDAYRAATAIVTSAIDAEGCTRVTVAGFSNGGAFAAKVYCRGESFGGRLAGVIVDDPVVDHAVEGCAPSAGVAVTLYWTGALAGQSYAGWNCADGDWTCDGGSTIGIAAYATALGAPVKASPHAGHSPYVNPPELVRF